MDDPISHGLPSPFDSQTFMEDGSFKLDKPVGSMSISPCGRDIVLASRQGLHIIDLDTPYAPPRHLPHHTLWEVADVQWSPFSSRDFWVVSTSNQKALVWNLAMLNSQASIQHVLHAHTRAITDINFSAHHPDVLATCAVDSFVHCWDLRHPARPAMTFCDWFAGATQVKWNRQDSHIIASSHDKFLRIWDDRKGAYPLHSIEAHDTKIYGIDWNRISPTRVVTCSLDKTIKLWDYSSEAHKPEHVLRTPFPIWRARHTPFGSGILAMPQRGNNDLHLYDQNPREHISTTAMDSPVYRFEGHQDQVKEFLWRSRGTIENDIDIREFQLVSWGADNILRLHRIDEQVLATVGHQKGKMVHGNLKLTRRDATYKSFREHPVESEFLTRNSVANTECTVQNPSGIRSGLSLGMSRTKIPASANWVNGAFMSSRHSPSSKWVERKDIDPIAWMKGVKIGKREGGLDQSATSSMSPIFKPDKHWEPFESFGEEISHVGDKFNKVKFEEIDVRKRHLQVSLSSPWGKDQANVYLQCQLSFPVGYPDTAAPTLEIGRIASIDTATFAKINTEVQVIAQAYLLHQRSSLEAIIHYLQGEVTANEITRWTKEVQEHDILEQIDDGQASSSDEEEDDDDEISYNRPQTDEAGLSGSGLISAGMANANVPLPKACGALWADNGRLVCFFPRKEDVTQSVLGSLGLRSPEAVSKGHDDLFAGFGHLHNNSPARKLKARTLESSKRGESDSDGTDSDSENSFFSSSDSSDSSNESVSPHPRSASLGLYAWRNKTSVAPRIESIMAESRNSNSSVHQSKLGTDTSKNVVSIHNRQSLLPVKQELAQAYQISGSDPCDNNRRVAEEQGLQDIANAWLILSMILRNEVPVLEMMQKGVGSRTLVVAPNKLQALTENDRNEHIAANRTTFRKMPHYPLATIKWGQHPLGGAGLIENLFSHFEHLGDVQMIAMIFGVLSNFGVLSRHERLGVPLKRSTLDDSPVVEGLLSPGHINGPHKDYFPFLEVALSLKQPTTPSIFVPQRSGKPRLESSPVGSSLGASNSDSIPPFSAGVTPPTNYITGRRSLERVESNGQGLSASPEQLRNAHRSNSNLATAFASFSKPFSFDTSASSSPPTTIPRKRFSPNGSYMAVPDANFLHGGMSGLSRTLNAIDEPKFAYKSQRLNKPHPLDVAKEPKFKITLKNQNTFHNEGYAKASLLDKVVQRQYLAYSDAYAYMLMMWEMPMMKIKLLKQSTIPTHSRSASKRLRDQQSTSLISIGRKHLGGEKHVGFAATLDVRRRCTRCGKVKTHDPLTGVFRCGTCAWRQVPLLCVFCNERIRGYVNPCLICSHVVHSKCRSYLSVDTTDAEPITAAGNTCISGCGCPCSEFDLPMVELPEHPPQKSSPSTIKENDQEEQGWRNEDTWEDVAYESLAKNLGAAGARYVRPKSSRIWRGLERKQSSRA